MIHVSKLTKYYGDYAAIRDVSFDVPKGQVVGFLGPNGAGKTTTMRMIAGFTAATSGRVSVAGYDMATENTAAAQHIGYLPERPPLYDTLDVTSYLRFVATVKGVPRAARAGDTGVLWCQHRYLLVNGYASIAPGLSRMFDKQS